MWLLAPTFLLDGCSDCFSPSLMTLYLLPGAHSGSRLLVPPHTNIHNKAKLIYPFLEIPPQAESTVVIFAFFATWFSICGGINILRLGNWDHDALEGGTPPPEECMGHSLACSSCLLA
jgi:hypothetical protein